MFRGPAPPVVLAVDTRPPAGAPLSAGLSERIGVPPDAPFHLHGIAPGTRGVHLVADLPLPPGALRDPTARLVEPPPLTLRAVDPARPVRLELVLERPTAVTIRARPPAGTDPVRCEARLLRADGGAFLQEQLRPSAGEARARLAVPRGTWRLLVHGAAAAESTGPAGRASLWAETELVVPGGGELELTLELEPAASVEGVALDGGGRPLADVRLQFAEEGWTAGGSPVWTHTARTDAGGRFLLHGLAPGRTYVCRDPAGAFGAGSAGRAGPVVLRR